MNILGLLEKFLNREDELISVNGDFCVRLKTPMAGCYECIERCPVSSIKITDTEVKILENCINCKACLYICPNSVFYFKNNNLTESATAKNSPSGDIYYFCSETGREIKTAGKTQFNKIECIFEIGDLDIITFFKKGKKLHFITGDCKSCKFKYFYGKKIKRIGEIKKFFNLTAGASEVNIKDFDENVFLEKETAAGAKEADGYIDIKNKRAEKKSNHDFEVLDRREFFINSLKGIKNKAKNIAGNLSIEDLPLSEFFSSGVGNAGYGNKKEEPGNKLLIERQKKLYLFLKENKELLPLLNIRLPKLNGNCAFCSNCWELCPTGALTFKEKEVSLEPFLCTGCNLCRDICGFGAVRMHRVKNIKDISNRKVLLSYD